MSTKTGAELADFGRRPGIKHAVANFQFGFVIGQAWQFWTEEDPRTENGIYPLATYKCITGGSLEFSRWTRL